MEGALVHPAINLLCYRYETIFKRTPGSRSIHGQRYMRGNLGRSELRGSVSGEGARGTRLDRRESLDSVPVHVGAVTACWLSNRRDVQADSAVGLLLIPLPPGSLGVKIRRRSCQSPSIEGRGIIKADHSQFESLPWSGRSVLRVTDSSVDVANVIKTVVACRLSRTSSQSF
jgi:hypothetical protein